VHAAVLAGDRESGLTVMWMDAGLDTGDILLQRTCAVEDTDTAGVLHDRLASMAPAALAEALDLIRSGTAPHLKQDGDLATYSPKLDRSSGRIDWHGTAGEIVRRVRGLHPWPGCTAEFELAGGKRLAVKIHRAEAVDGSAPAGTVVLPLDVGCGAGGLVRILEVQPAGGKKLTAAEFARGYNAVRVVTD
jgi:methionyl-tRNA formyltransferase